MEINIDREMNSCIQMFPRLVNLSLPKCASTSLAKVFCCWNTVHEGLHMQSVNQIIDFYESKTTVDTLREFLLRRQLILNTRIDSSTFLHFVSEQLADLLPSKTSFIQILRDPYSWTISYLGMLYEFGSIVTIHKSSKLSLWSSRYGQFQVPEMTPQRIYREIEDEEYMTYIIDGLSAFWLQSTMHVQNTIEPGRLIVFRLSEIDTYLPHLAFLAGIDSEIPLKAPVENTSQTRAAALDRISHHMSRSIEASRMFEKASSLFERTKSTY